MIWIIGEYAERIDNADELLESFLETFPEEPAQVQLQLLTATVKLFLKKPTEGPQQMIQVSILLQFHYFQFFIATQSSLHSSITLYCNMQFSLAIRMPLMFGISFHDNCCHCHFDMNCQRV